MMFYLYLVRIRQRDVFACCIFARYRKDRFQGTPYAAFCRVQAGTRTEYVRQLPIRNADPWGRLAQELSVSLRLLARRSSGSTVDRNVTWLTREAGEGSEEQLTVLLPLPQAVTDLQILRPAA